MPATCIMRGALLLQWCMLCRHLQCCRLAFCSWLHHPVVCAWPACNACKQYVGHHSTYIRNVMRLGVGCLYLSPRHTVVSGGQAQRRSPCRWRKRECCRLFWGTALPRHPLPALPVRPQMITFRI